MVGFAFHPNVSEKHSVNKKHMPRRCQRVLLLDCEQSTAGSQEKVRTYVFLEEPKEVLRHERPAARCFILHLYLLCAQ